MIKGLATVRLLVKTVEDIVRARRSAREMAMQIGFGLADQTRLATAVSELARNAVHYGKGGECEVSDHSTESLKVLRVTIRDQGPGIRDLDIAMRDGFSSGSGLGAGLPGCKRLMDVFLIESSIGEGTRVQIEIHADHF